MALPAAATNAFALLNDEEDEGTQLFARVTADENKKKEEEKKKKEKEKEINEKKKKKNKKQDPKEKKGQPDVQRKVYTPPKYMAAKRLVLPVSFLKSQVVLKKEKPQEAAAPAAAQASETPDANNINGVQQPPAVPSNGTTKQYYSNGTGYQRGYGERYDGRSYGYRRNNYAYQRKNNNNGGGGGGGEENGNINGGCDLVAEDGWQLVNRRRVRVQKSHNNVAAKEQHSEKPVKQQEYFEKTEKKQQESEKITEEQQQVQENGSKNSSEGKKREPTIRLITLKEYEKVCLRKKKALLGKSMKEINEEKTVDLKKEFESMHLIGKKREDDDQILMMRSNKSGKEGLNNKEEKITNKSEKEGLNKEEKITNKPKTVTINEFLGRKSTFVPPRRRPEEASQVPPVVSETETETETEPERLVPTPFSINPDQFPGLKA